MQEQKLTIDALKEYICSRDLAGVIFQIVEEYMNIGFEEDKIILFNTEEDLKTVTHPLKQRVINHADIKILSLEVIDRTMAIVTVTPIGKIVVMSRQIQKN